MDGGTKVADADEVMASTNDVRKDNGPLILQSIWDCYMMICNCKLNMMHVGHCGDK